MKAVYHVLFYLKLLHQLWLHKSICFHGLCGRKSGGGWGDGKFTTEWLTVNGAIAWSSHRRSNVAISTREGKYLAVFEAGRGAIARTNLFTYLNIELITSSAGILCDNEGASTIASKPAQHQRAKHIANALKNVL
jgi:hypothetical protein